MIVDHDNFNKEVLKEKKPVFVEIGADWSGTSHIIAPIIKYLAEKYNEKVKFIKLDADGDYDWINKYYTDKIPAILIFKNGEIQDSIKGVFSSKELENIICEQLK